MSSEHHVTRDSDETLLADRRSSSGFCTCMKTAEITRHKQAATGIKPPSTWAVFADIYRREGIRGINKGVNAVAVRQCTNWGSRYVVIKPEMMFGA